MDTITVKVKNKKAKAILKSLAALELIDIIQNKNDLLDTDDKLEQLLKPRRKKLNLDKLVKAQKFQGVNKEQFNQAIQAINLEGDLKELLETLK